ncbi:MAG: hypothetical protein IJV27_07635 [Prevotella sp.]|nr:hypothetical protein [Prevotella sp.]
MAQEWWSGGGVPDAGETSKNGRWVDRWKDKVEGQLAGRWWDKTLARVYRVEG